LIDLLIFLPQAYICADGAEILQKNEFCVEKDACLFVLPDPTLLQKGSVLSQHQVISAYVFFMVIAEILRRFMFCQVVNLAAGGNAVLLDWYVAGREGLLEHWEGTR
jgi:urease accessory protein UreH